MAAEVPDCEHVPLLSDGLTLAACLYRPIGAGGPAPAVLIVPGFASCKEHHADFARAAAAAGFVALTLDLRGQGASEGCLDSRTVHDLHTALAFLQADPQVDPDRVAVRGSSMGGCLALHAAARWSGFAAVVAVAPASEALLAALLREIEDPESPPGRRYRAQAGFPRVMGCDLGCWLEAHTLLEAVQHLAGRPLLLIHCAGDAEVPASISGDLYAAAAEPKTFWLLPGGDHTFAQHDPAITARALTWLRAQDS